MERPVVMLTFDLEEFDIPEEYGQPVSEEQQMQVTLAGMERLLPILDAQEIRVTFFTTGHFAEKNPELIRLLAAKHEIASHALYHSPAHPFTESDIPRSKEILEEVSGQSITGFRMPRLKPFDEKILTKWGFDYDSSINPTWLPGRYNLLHRNPIPEFRGALLEVPCSTTPWIRFPLFWLSLKNLPPAWYHALCKLTLRSRNNLMLYFHPWEFADLAGYRLPRYVKTPDGEILAGRLDQLISVLKKQKAVFETCQNFCETLSDNREGK